MTLEAGKRFSGKPVVLGYDTLGRPIYGVRLIGVDLSSYKGRRVKLRILTEDREISTTGRVVSKAQYHYILLPTDISRMLGPKLGRRPSRHTLEVFVDGVL